MPNHANAVFRALVQVDPFLPWLLLSIATETLLRFVRRMFPEHAKRIPAKWDLIPAALIAGGFASLSTDFQTLTAFFGAVFGSLGPLWRTEPPKPPQAPPGPPPASSGGALVVLLVALTMTACGGAMPADEPAYQTCQGVVAATWREKRRKLCPPDKVKFLECDHQAALMAELKEDQEACRGR